MNILTAISDAVKVVRTYKKGKAGYNTPLLIDAYHAVAVRQNIPHKQALEEALGLVEAAALLEAASEDSDDAEQLKQEYEIE